MVIAVFANNEQWEEMKLLSAAINFVRLKNVNDKAKDASAYFILDKINEFDFSIEKTPVFINAVETTFHTLHAPENAIRINAWKGFLKNKIWETSGIIDSGAAAVLSALNKKYILVPDEPGFIAARIIAMIINEAYFALGENVSSKAEIDIAMKLGTNYPFGPFEWAKIVGIKNIFSLLNTLSATDKRCMPAPLLQKEAIT